MPPCTCHVPQKVKILRPNDTDNILSGGAINVHNQLLLLLGLLFESERSWLVSPSSHSPATSSIGTDKSKNYNKLGKSAVFVTRRERVWHVLFARLSQDPLRGCGARWTYEWNLPSHTHNRTADFIYINKRYWLYIIAPHFAFVELGFVVEQISKAALTQHQRLSDLLYVSVIYWIPKENILDNIVCSCNSTFQVCFPNIYFKHFLEYNI